MRHDYNRNLLPNGLIKICLNKFIPNCEKGIVQISRRACIFTGQVYFWPGNFGLNLGGIWLGGWGWIISAYFHIISK